MKEIAMILMFFALFAVYNRQTECETNTQTVLEVKKQDVKERIEFLKKLMEVEQTEESLQLIHREMGELTMIYGTFKY